MGEHWGSSIFGCFNNCGLSVVTFIAPCYTMGKNAELMGDSFYDHCCCFFVPCINVVMRVSQRTRIRERQGIESNACADCLCVILLPFCSLVQEGQEVRRLSKVTTGADKALDIERA